MLKVKKTFVNRWPEVKPLTSGHDTPAHWNHQELSHVPQGNSRQARSFTRFIYGIHCTCLDHCGKSRFVILLVDVMSVPPPDIICTNNTRWEKKIPSRVEKCEEKVLGFVRKKKTNKKQKQRWQAWSSIVSPKKKAKNIQSHFNITEILRASKSLHVFVVKSCLNYRLRWGIHVNIKGDVLVQGCNKCPA